MAYRAPALSAAVRQCRAVIHIQVLNGILYSGLCLPPTGYCTFTTAFDKAAAVQIGQGLSLIPMTEELFDQINAFETSSGIGNFVYLTVTVEEKILDIIGDRAFSYVEAEHHGGQGGQIAIIWKDKTRHQLLELGENRINQVLQYFGVVANKGEDEFSTLGFGLRRHTKEWLEEQN